MYCFLRYVYLKRFARLARMYPLLSVYLKRITRLGVGLGPGAVARAGAVDGPEAEPETRAKKLGSQPTPQS